MLDGKMNLAIGDLRISLDHDMHSICYVSHAHTDHSKALKTKKKEKAIIASRETLALSNTDKQSIEYSNLPNVKLKLINAGHILGSTQLVVESDLGKIVYTGDFKLSDGLTIKGAEIEECDYLIIDTTYGLPEYKFPKKEDVYEQISKWVNRNYEKGNVVLGAYSTGKAQELIKLLNENSIIPLVHEKIAKVSNIYNKLGSDLDFTSLQSEEANELLNRNYVAIIPQHNLTFELVSKLKNFYPCSISCAIATGWALSRRFYVDAFPLSDHADFSEVVTYIEQSKPKRVFCWNGQEELSAQILRNKGFDAVPISEAQQMHL